MRHLFIITGIFMLFLTANSQELEVDSVMKLPAVEVSATRLDNHSSGQKIRSVDSITLLQSNSLNLGEVLANSSALQVNTYSHNGLSTLSFRGTSVAQSGLFWNGFQINPPNNGQVDLSLIPAGYFNSLKVLYGGGSSLYGSGNIGGSLHLNSEKDFRKHSKLSLGFRAGSFDEFGVDASYSYANGKLYSKTSLLGKQAKNDFPYTDLSGTEVNLENAALEQFGFMQDIYYRTKKQWVFGASFWYQQNDKQLPASMTSKPSDASQFDNSFRTIVSAVKYNKAGKFSVRSALFHDRSHFMDPDTIESIAIDSEIITTRSSTEAQYERALFKNSLLNAGINYSYENGASEYYKNKETRNQLGLFASWAQYIPSIQWKINLNLRQDLIENYQVPFTPSFGFEGKVYKIVSAKFNVSRNFRVPTFNDQFWVPGGNVDLKPEHSWNEEVSLIFDLYMEKMRNKTSMTFTAFNSNVDNWILWVPDGVYWSAQNIQEVWSRGGEFEYQSTFSVSPVDIQFVGAYTWVKSTNEKKINDNDQSYQKQLIYVPEQRGFFTGSLLIKGFIVSYNQSYTGIRYVTRDNEEKLPAYTLGNIFLRKQIHLGDHRLDVGFDIFNVWDKEYQAVQYNPMPGRNFKFSIKFILNNQVKKNDKN